MRLVQVSLVATALSAAIGLVGWLDAATGTDFGFSLVYLLPVLLGAWLHGRMLAVLLAVEAAALWWLVESQTAAHSPLAHAWNGITRLSIFLMMGVGLAVLREDRERFQVLLAREAMFARTDPLTGLENSRAFRENAARDLARARRDRVPVTLVYVDIDNFKWVNDQHGHKEGDAVLAEIAGMMRALLREGDHAARLGGDEFGLLLWDADADAGEKVAARIIDAVRALGRGYPGSALGASAGFATLGDSMATVDDLLQAADDAMYQVKRSGKGAARRSLAPPRLA
jgi:diguanylate cyclase (GGDEF)-like protein